MPSLLLFAHPLYEVTPPLRRCERQDVIRIRYPPERFGIACRLVKLLAVVHGYHPVGVAMDQQKGDGRHMADSINRVVVAGNCQAQ